MLKMLNNKRAQVVRRGRRRRPCSLPALSNVEGQAVMGEYALVIFMVLAVIVAMTVYFKRSVQARIHDARDHMISEVRLRTAGSFNGNLYKEYEPYYTKTDSNIFRYTSDRTELTGGGLSGVFNKAYNQTTTVVTNGEVLPPRDFDLTTPIN